VTDNHQDISPQLDFAADDTLAGFRLQRLEVFNWGTFDGQVWHMDLDGRNALLTGDIGSGKSTLVDAVTTLLVPAHRVAYNKAAGAGQKERSLRSYVLGYYKSERNENSVKARPVALRDINSYSVILGVFHNQGYDQTVTLAQVFWMKELQGQPDRFYVAAEKALSIKQDFADFGHETAALRKRLRKSGCEIIDRFPQYGAWFRRRFGINNEQALDLFHQTVSMKSVGNLTEFVRGHMLEPFTVESRISNLIAHFDDLNRAHGAVLKARRQIELLSPLIENCERHQALNGEVAILRQSRETLVQYFAQLKLQLIQARLQRLDIELKQHHQRAEQLGEQLNRQQQDERDLKQQIAENGGDRIERLQQEIRQTEKLRNQRQQKAKRYEELLQPLKLSATDSPEGFVKQQQILQQQLEDTRKQLVDSNNRRSEIEFNFREVRKNYQQLKQQINDLKARRSNIEQAQIDIRAALCKALQLPEDELPFAGELIQVRADESTWQGAIERLLHNFGLSMLVPDKHYARVMEWIDATRLRGRLVYYRVREASSADLPRLHPDSLIHKIIIKPDSAFYTWLEQEISRRFDVACCETTQQFRREKRAITRQGQIKSAGGRHEKDDRHAINDRSRFVLGWSNKDKIAALQSSARLMEREMADLGAHIGHMEAAERALQQTIDAIHKLEEYQNFEELDWQPLALDIDHMQQELQQLESASDLLKTLTEQLKVLQQQLELLQQKQQQALAKHAKTEQKIEDAQCLQQATQALISEMPALTKDQLSAFDTMREQALGEHKLTVESCDPRQQDMRKWLQDKIDSKDRKLRTLAERIIQAMSDFKHEYALETKDTDAAVEAADEYHQILNELRANDLPRFEQRFKELLNENTIREIASFQSQLNRERETIRDRIAQINESLTQIDYNPGRYIRLEAEVTQDSDVRDFQSELRHCTEGSLTGSEGDQYSEAKFLQVKQIVERFRGREGSSDLDKRWTRKVTDVRNWFSFAASERWREDDVEHEHYSDSGGKSGGQKEKLAYTILAASLAYQFGLEWGEVRSRSFRFVVIDEAFGRGSDESAQYGLKLFEQLNLQLLIVTPLQKIHIIEPYVSSVGFVHNEAGKTSRIRNLSITAYRAEKSRNGRSEA
jgi:uncharacterized protein YPO0396